ncbi:MAG: 2-methylcitrate dehydratase PrpD [Rhizobacter sp.]|nr:2-methylcitrate dehydratase PrpD [Rhizobacter sp.]
MREPTLSRTLGDFVANLQVDALPVETIAAVRRHLLDTLGAAIGGAAQSEPQSVLAASRAAFGSVGVSPVWGSTHSASPGVAALVNGTAAHALELDDASGCDHSGAVVMPAVFAAFALQSSHASFAPEENDVIAAIVAGYDVGRRVMEASGGYDGHNGAGWHSTGTCGVFASAAAVARVLRCDGPTTARALGIAGSFASGTWAFLADGAMTKRMHPGHAASSGLVAVEMARNGLIAPSQIFEADWGGFFKTYVGDKASPELLTQGLGKDWRIHRSSIKPFASCRGTHAAVEAVLGLRDEWPAPRIHQVTVTVTPTVARMCGGTAVDTFVDAQMSLPYAVAIAALYGSADASMFDAGHRADSALRDFMARVGIEEDTTLPSNVAARVTLVDGNGNRQERSIDVPLGSPGNPLSDAMLRYKYDALATPVLGPEGAATLADAVAALGHGADLPALLRATRPTASRTPRG